MAVSAQSRQDYVQNVRKQAKRLIFEENLPQASDLLAFKKTGRATKKLQRIFDYFGNEDDVKNLLNRHDYFYSPQESQEHLDSVIAANVKDIAKNGILYQQLLASCDSYLVAGEDCKSRGEQRSVPTTKEDFIYDVRDMIVSFNGKDWETFFDFEEFRAAAKNAEKIWVRSPLTCKHMKEHKVCRACAGKLSERIEYIGAFATMLVTEADTQNALSSMNKGVKESSAAILAEMPSKATELTLREFRAWAKEKLDELRTDVVERRWYEIALASRLLKEPKKDGYYVKKLSEPTISPDALYGNFIYRPNKKNYRALVSAGSFQDSSLQTRIAFCDF